MLDGQLLRGAGAGRYKYPAGQRPQRRSSAVQALQDGWRVLEVSLLEIPKLTIHFAIVATIR